MHRTVIAVVTAAAFASGCGPSWPRPVAAVDPAMTAHATAVTHVDLLPIDLAVWTKGGAGADAIRLRVESALVGATTETLYQRGYQLGAQVGWDGAFVGDDGVPHGALTPDELLGTLSVLSSYGDAVARLGGLPQPPLPARLGASGAQATLYVGGWSYVGDDGGGAGKVVKTALVVAIVVVAIVSILALSERKTGKRSSSLGDAAGAVGQAAAATGRVALRTLARAGTATIHVVHGTASLADVMWRTMPGRRVPRMLDPTLELVIASRDPYGPPTWQVSAPPPAWDQRPAQPRSGRSRLYLEMTLVDNRDGHVLWHVAQRFPASGAREADVIRAADAMLATLPAIR